jgi:hypothetical protein
LKTGDVFFRDTIVYIPYVDDAFKRLVAQKIIDLPRPNAPETEETPIEEENVFDQAFLDEMFLKYGQSAGYNIDYTNKEVLVDFWLSKGYSDHIIVKYLVKGNTQELLTLCQKKRRNTKTDSAD